MFTFMFILWFLFSFISLFCVGWNLVVKILLKRLKMRWNASLRKWFGYLGSILFRLIFRLLAQGRTEKERWAHKILRGAAFVSAIDMLTRLQCLANLELDLRCPLFQEYYFHFTLSEYMIIQTPFSCLPLSCIVFRNQFYIVFLDNWNFFVRF